MVGEDYKTVITGLDPVIHGAVPLEATGPHPIRIARQSSCNGHVRLRGTMVPRIKSGDDSVLAQTSGRRRKWGVRQQ
jgi:hypothetical protein